MLNCIPVNSVNVLIDYQYFHCLLIEEFQMKNEIKMPFLNSSYNKNAAKNDMETVDLCIFF